jgi:hypothetical protein
MEKELMATLISVYPFDIYEQKPAIYPGTFYIPAAKDGPTSLIIGEAFHFVDRVDAPPLRIRVLPQELAKSIVYDWTTAAIGVDIEEDVIPGLFYVNGAHENSVIEVLFANEINAAKARQRKWFIELVKIADDDWSRYHKHTVISDIQRYAVKELNLEREWSIIVQEQALKLCPACKSTTLPGAVVCSSCKAVLDLEKYKTFQFAGV